MVDYDNIEYIDYDKCIIIQTFYKEIWKIKNKQLISKVINLELATGRMKTITPEEFNEAYEKYSLEWL